MCEGDQVYVCMGRYACMWAISISDLATKAALSCISLVPRPHGSGLGMRLTMHVVSLPIHHSL